MATTTRKSAAAAEVLGEQVPFTYKGAQYLVLPTSEWTLDTIEAFETGRMTAFLREILGEAQYATYKATKPKVAEIQDFMAEIQKALGISGN
jgi:hypothetical protein